MYMFTKLKAEVGQKEFDSRMINLALIIAFLTLLLLTYLFTIKFGFGLPDDLQTWQTTSSYFQNIIALLTGPLSLLVLYFVWKDNRQELAETKKALTEQSDTQNFSVIKDAVFDVVEQVKLLTQKKVVLINYDKEIKLFDLDDESLTVKNEDVDDDMKYKSTTYITEDLIHDYFIWAISEKASEIPRSISQKNLIYSGQFFDYIDKIKTLALFMQALKSPDYRQILEITLFSKLSIFTWLFFVEIAYHLLKYADDREKKVADLVFAEIAGLTCRQLKDIYWINSLSDEVLLELKERKLL